MKAMVLTLVAALAMTSFANAADSTVTLTANAEVTRQCTLDFAPENASHQATLVFNALNISLAPREVGGTEEVSATVYETCNDNYKIVLKSLYGGLKHQANGYIHPYSATYVRSNDTQTLTMTSAQLLGGIGINKLIDDWRANHPGNEGKTPLFAPRQFSLSIPKAAGLEVGFYTDTISIEIADSDPSGSPEISYDIGGSAPEAPPAQVILTGGG